MSQKKDHIDIVAKAIAEERFKIMIDNPLLFALKYSKSLRWLPDFGDLLEFEKMTRGRESLRKLRESFPEEEDALRFVIEELFGKQLGLEGRDFPISEGFKQEIIKKAGEYELWRDMGKFFLEELKKARSGRFPAFVRGEGFVESAFRTWMRKPSLSTAPSMKGNIDEEIHELLSSKKQAFDPIAFHLMKRQDRQDDDQPPSPGRIRNLRQKAMGQRGITAKHIKAFASAVSEEGEKMKEEVGTELDPSEREIALKRVMQDIEQKANSLLNEKILAYLKSVQLEKEGH